MFLNIDHIVLTINVMEKTKSWEYNSFMGEKLREIWIDLASKYSLPLKIGGIKPIPSFTIESANFLKYKTLITQEMLKKGFLASNIVFLCTSHTTEILNEYQENLDDIFLEIAECEHGKDIDSLLEGPICHSGFKRLN